MKQGTAINRIIMIVLLGAVLIYLAVSAWTSLTDPFSTMPSYLYSIDDTVECTGYVVREETVLTGSGGIVELLPAEGEKVAVQETVALLYQSEAGLDRRQAIQTLMAEREQLQYALQHLDGGGDTAQLSQQIIQAIAALRASVSAGELTGLEDQTLSLRSLIYKQGFAYGDTNAAESLAAAVQQVDGQLASLNAQAAQDTVRVTTPQSGIFSAQVDGYEDVLTPEALNGLTLSGLQALTEQRRTPEAGAIGKLITGIKWYFLCPLAQADAVRLTVGKTITVRFSRDWSGEVDMQVERIADPENGQSLVVLSSDHFLSDTTLLRRQTVELVFGTTTGILVPKLAVRVEDKTLTDSETGEESTVPVTCVYALVGVQAELKPVNILLQQDNFCLVEPVPSERQSEQKKILRAGDEIIVAAEDLYDGKVVR